MMLDLSVLLLTCHLLAMNIASVGPLVAIWLHRRGRNGDDAAWEIGRRLSRFALGCLFIGILVGLAQLGLSWAGVHLGIWRAVARISSQEMGFIIIELLFSFVCLSVYVATWNRWRMRPWLHALFAVLATTNLLYHFPPLMSALGELSVRPALSTETTLTHAALRSVIRRPEVLSLTVHFIVASVAVTGVALMQIARRSARSEHSSDANYLIVIGARQALAASVVQLGVGTWVLVALPPHARGGLIGSDMIATGLFLLSILGALAILHTLAGISLGNVTQSAITRSTLLMIAVVLMMTATLARSRELSSPRAAALAHDNWEGRSP